MARRTLTTETTNSSTKIKGHFDVADLFFVLVYFFIMFMFANFVNARLRTLYYIFNILVALFLCGRSSVNQSRRNYESLYFILTKETDGYRPYYSEQGE